MTEPFFVPFGQRHRFRGLSFNGYLPALESDDAPKIEYVYRDIEWTHRQWDKAQQLEARLLHLQKAVYKLSAKKQGRKDIIPENRENPEVRDNPEISRNFEKVREVRERA